MDRENVELVKEEPYFSKIKKKEVTLYKKMNTFFKQLDPLVKKDGFGVMLWGCMQTGLKKLKMSALCSCFMQR